MGLVSVQLGACRVADDVQALGDAQPTIPRVGLPGVGVQAVVLEPQVRDREVTPHGEEDRMPLDGRAIVEVDDVRAVLAGTRVRLDGLHAGPHGHPVPLQR